MQLQDPGVEVQVAEHEDGFKWPATEHDAGTGIRASSLPRLPAMN